MAHKEAAELHIMHVWHLFAEGYVRGRGMDAQDIQAAREQEKEQRKQLFDALLSRMGVADLKPHLHLIEGSARLSKYGDISDIQASRYLEPEPGL